MNPEVLYSQCVMGDKPLKGDSCFIITVSVVFLGIEPARSKTFVIPLMIVSRLGARFAGSDRVVIVG